MLRKITLGLVAAGALGAAALAPTSASAWAGFRGPGVRVVVGGPVFVRPFHRHGWCYWRPYRCF